MFVVGCAGPPRKATWSNATGAGEFERLMWKAVKEKDWKKVDYHLAPAFVGVTPDGQTLDRDAWMEYWKAANVQELVFGEHRTHPAGVDVVVTSVLQVSRTSASPGAAEGYRVLSVWQQIKHGWILTTTSLTPITSH
jgi:hypothetical protein